MAAFAYEAVDGAGRHRRGKAEAPDVTALTRTLEEKGLLVLEVQSADAQAAPRATMRFGSRKDVLEITRALASLLPAGVPLARALGAASNVAPGPVGAALDTIRDQIEGGDTLASALAKHPDFFSPVYVGLVRVGERTGDLAGSFRRLAAQLDREQALRANLLSASIYPLLLAGFGGLSVLVLLFFVIPRFAELLEGSGAMLPRSTAFLLGASQALRASWPLLIALAVGGAMAASWGLSTDRGKRLVSRVMVRAPAFRVFKRNALGAQFARMVGTLLSGGAPLVSALGDSVQSISDPLAADETSRIASRVREGASLHETIRGGSLFPPLLAQLVAVGEESGRLPEFMLKAAEILEEKTDRALQRLVTVLEPLMIVVFGAIVAVVALSLLQAIYSANAGSF